MMFCWNDSFELPNSSRLGSEGFFFSILDSRTVLPKGAVDVITV